MRILIIKSIQNYILLSLKNFSTKIFYKPKYWKLRRPHWLSKSNEETINWNWALTKFDSDWVSSFSASRIFKVVRVPTPASFVTPSTAITLDSTDNSNEPILDFVLSIFFHVDWIWKIKSSFLDSRDLKEEIAEFFDFSKL